MKHTIEHREETRDDILDTIRTCEIFLEDAEKNATGPFAHLFSRESRDFARAQIAFELEKLKALEVAGR